MKSICSIFCTAVALSLSVFVTNVNAAPTYVEVGTLPVPSASERGEFFDAATQTLFSFPYYDGSMLRTVYSSRPGAGASFTWTQTTSFPTSSYWGRGASDGTNYYFTGNISGVSRRTTISASGLLN